MQQIRLPMIPYPNVSLKYLGKMYCVAHIMDSVTEAQLTFICSSAFVTDLSIYTISCIACPNHFFDTIE